MKCARCGKEAVAVLNKKMPLCQECVIAAEAYSLKIGAMVGISLQGESRYLIIPREDEG
jgi:NMD protein affecting ribosome stability and mRNA decay